MNQDYAQAKEEYEEKISEYYENYYYNKYQRLGKETEAKCRERIAKEEKKRKKAIGFLLAGAGLLSFLTFIGGNSIGEDAGYKKGFDEGYNSGHEIGYYKGHEIGHNEGYYDGLDAPRPSDRPESGHVFIANYSYGDSEITVNNNSSVDYVISLKDMSGNLEISFYVRSGESTTIPVQEKRLEIYFACGPTWYGYGKDLMFGDLTTYSKGEESMNFDGYTWTYTLESANGNTENIPSDEYDFFE